MFLLSHFSKFVYCFKMSACASNSNKFSPQQRVGETSVCPRRNGEGKKTTQIAVLKDKSFYQPFSHQIKLSKTYQVLRICRPRNGKIKKHCVSFDYFEKTFLSVCANYRKRKYGHIPKTFRSQGPSFL